MLIAGTIAFVAGFAAAVSGAESMDPKLRADFQAGFGGDRQAMERAMKQSEELLARNPKFAEVKVWHGAAIFAQAGPAAEKGDFEEAMRVVAAGSDEMKAGVDLEPDNPAVRAARGFILLGATRYMPEDYGTPYLETALADLEKVVELGKTGWDQVPPNERASLLYGLGEGYSRAGNAEKAKTYFERVAAEHKDSKYAANAKKWLETKTLTLEERNCTTCAQN